MQLLALGFLLILFAAGAGAQEPAPLFSLTKVFEAGFAAQGRTVVTRTREGVVGLWDASNGQPLPGAPALPAKSEYILDPSGECLAILYQEGGAQVFEAASGKALSPRLEIQALPPRGPKGAFFPDLSRLILLDPANHGVVFEVTSGERLMSIPPSPNALSDRESYWPFRFSADGKMGFMQDTGGVVIPFRTTPGDEPVAPPMMHPYREGYNFNFDVSPDARYLCTGDSPGENGPKGYLQLWDAVKGQPLGEPLVKQNGLGGSFLADGRLLVTGERYPAAVFEVPSLKKLFELPAHDDVNGPAVANSPDGALFLTWGYDSRICATDAKTGALLAETPVTGIVFQVHFAPDGRRCFALTRAWRAPKHDCTLSIFTLPKLKLQTSQLLGSVQRIDLAPDGSRILTLIGEKVWIFDSTTLAPLFSPPIK